MLASLTLAVVCGLLTFSMVSSMYVHGLNLFLLACMPVMVILTLVFVGIFWKMYRES